MRAAMFAATCVLLAAVGHVLMSDKALPWWAMAAGFAGVGASAWILAGHERGLFSVTSAAIVVQGALHYGFSLVQAGTGTAGGNLTHPPGTLAHGAVMAHTGHHMEGAVPPGSVTAMNGATGTPAPGDTAGMAGMADMSSTGMLSAHLLAALLCGLWLAYGEQGAFRVLRAVVGRIRLPLGLLFRLPPPAHRPRVRTRRDHRPRPLRGLLLVHAITSRGPPQGIAVN
ncbi:hypothetical protein [Streptomyces sp. NBC_01426]|uniref:hypothetical protein n=1 Tax=Streptomyces sp. NBC_01426 TaxID=2975866 RepID=UPI002E301B17|nr:hypothetical protein [Streptomyces sp. NBC_01426]